MPRTREIVPVAPTQGATMPVPANEVRLVSGFWADRQRLNTTALLDHADRWIASMGWFDTFAVAAGAEPTIPLQGKLFTDADVYKLLEAFAWEVASRPNDVREKRIREVGALIAAAQEEDGYLNTFFGPRGRAARYTDLGHGHELYCAGHLFQAAVARLRSGVEDDLTATAIRLADRICEDFGPGGIQGSDGHPEIEVGLMELYRATGEQRYLDQAKKFIDERGGQTFDHHAIGHEYYIDDMPIREATVMRGHVVRAMYLAAGAVDLAIETGDDDLLSALKSQWSATWARRTYITGGMGSRHLGESFGSDFELPPDRAYTETCGAVGAIMVAWRLLLATGEVQYADAIERLLYNMIATHPSADGERFFYVNPLLRREPGISVPDGVAPFRKDTLRANWFWVACCPTNVVRLLSSLSGYFSSRTADSLTIHQYFGGDIDTQLGDGRAVSVGVETDYPWDGTVTVRIRQTTGPWTLRLRVPDWASGATVTIDGDTTEASPGYIELSREWAHDDVVTLTLPIEPRLTAPDPRISAVRGTLAIERGPLVYCAEEVVDRADHVDLDFFVIDATQPLADVEPEPVSDVGRAIRARGWSLRTTADHDWPYGAPQALPVDHPAEVTLVPYYSWSNRGPSTMRVWIAATRPDASHLKGNQDE